MNHLLLSISRRWCATLLASLLAIALVVVPVVPGLAQTVPAHLELSPASAPAGAVVTATGSGFPAGLNGQLLWADGSFLVPLFTDGSGWFSVTVEVPAVAPGAYAVSAVTEDGTTATATLTIEAVPEPIAAPTEAPTDVPIPTEEPTAVPLPTEVPTAVPLPTDVPTQVPPPPYYPIVGSGQSANSLPAAVVYDGDPATTWLTEPIAPAEAWFVLDLGQSLPIGSLRWLLATAGTLGPVEFQLSDDGTTWVTFGQVDGTALPVGTWMEQPVGIWARFVRFQMLNPQGLVQLGGIAEVEVWPAAEALPLAALVPSPTAPPPTATLAPTLTPTIPPTAVPTATLVPATVAPPPTEAPIVAAAQATPESPITAASPVTPATPIAVDASTPSVSIADPTAGDVVFQAVADAEVRRATPNTNYGSRTVMRADLDPVVHTYLRFDVNGLTAPIENATLRVWAVDGTHNGPPVYLVADTSWSETGITWNTRPGTTTPVGDKGAISGGSWVEYDVTSLVEGDGPVSFALVPQSSNGLYLNTRETAINTPQLVITTSGDSGSTPAPIVTPPVGPVTSAYAPAADTYVVESEPDTNYGAASTLQSDQSPSTEIYLRFDVNDVSGPVQVATLRVYVSQGTPNGPGVSVLEGTSWSESGLTWSNKPVMPVPIVDTESAPPGQWLEYDVTSSLNGNGVYTFALIPQSSDGLYINSREAASNPPQLVITTLGGGAPTPVLPTPAAPTPVPSGETAVLLAAGDISTCANDGDEQTAKILDGQGGTIATLGDNVYDSGTAQQFADCYNPTWGRHKERTMPAPGNHEYNTAGAAGYFQYFGPAAGGGYYSYNLGDWHIISLNSQIAMDVGSAQESWLRSDLAANPAQCTLAYWHEPLYSSGGSHGNEPETRPLFQALYEHGAEIVLNGHDHTYERFAPQNATGQADADYGIREFVVGTGGRNLYSFGTIQPNSEARHNRSLGILKLTLAPGGYTWEFLPVAGASYSDSGSGTCHDAPVDGVNESNNLATAEVPALQMAFVLPGGDTRRQDVARGRRKANGTPMASTVRDCWERRHAGTSDIRDAMS